MNEEKMIISPAGFEDAKILLSLQKKAFYPNAVFYNDFTLPPLVESLADYKATFSSFFVLKVMVRTQIIGSVKGKAENGTCYISRLIVHPDFQNQGIGRMLMAAMESHFLGKAQRFELFTGHKSEKNLSFYQKLGYQVFKTDSARAVPICYLEKIVSV